MGQVLIRNLDEALIADYRRAAADRGRSLESELRDALDRGRPRKVLRRDEVMALIDRLWAATPGSATQIDSTPSIRASRDRG